MTRPTLDFRLTGAKVTMTTRDVEGQGRGLAAARVAAEQLGVSRVVRLRQVHGNRIVSVPRDLPDEDLTTFLGDGDSLISAWTNVGLAVITADCVPVVLAEKRGQVIAAVHSGWRGTTQDVLPRTIEEIRRTFEVNAGELEAMIGPAAGGCCYEVGEEVVEALARVAPGSLAEADWLRRTDPRPHVDLRRFVHGQLLAAGVSTVQDVNACTMCHPETWPSFRRHGSSVGRIWTVVTSHVEDHGDRR